MGADRRRRSAETERRPGKAASGKWIECRGQVVRLLSDDLDEARHQRAVLRLGDGQTVLVAHNLEVSERVPFGIGDRVDVRGLFEWNDLGGLLHWTHRDPMGIEDGGYIRFRRRIFD